MIDVTITNLDGKISLSWDDGQFVLRVSNEEGAKIRLEPKELDDVMGILEIFRTHYVEETNNFYPDP